MSIWKRLVLLFIVCSSCIGCDQVTKVITTRSLPRNEMTPYFHDFLRVGYVENTGAFLGLGGDIPPQLRFLVFQVLAGAFLLGFFVYLLVARLQDVRLFLGYSLILAGGASNLLDRLFRDGAVVDMLNLGIGPVRTGIFNVADMAITAGLGMLLILAFRFRQEPPIQKT